MMTERRGKCPKCQRRSWENTDKGVWHCFHCGAGGNLSGYLPKIAKASLKPKPEWQKYLTKIPGHPQVDKFLEKYPNLWRSQIVTWEIFGKIYISPLEETVLKPLNKENTPLTLVSGHLLLKGNSTLVLVEDFISGYCVHNAGFSVLVLNGTSLHQPEKLLGFEEILVWLDGDTPGITAAKKLQTRYGWRCIITPRDPKYYTNTEILNHINQ